MNKKLLALLSVLFLCFLTVAFQYVEVLKLELVKAYDASKPVNGHDWSEMQCTEGLCVTDDNKVGIGTSTPGSKLDVSGAISASGNINSSGNITAVGDVCGGGACLSQIASYVGSQPLVMNVHNQAACTTAGGTVVPSDVSFPMCKFSASSCPTESTSNGTGLWTQYKSYEAYGPTTCYIGSPGGCYGDSGATPCTTGSTEFLNNPPSPPTCTYCAGSSRPCGDYGCCVCYSSTCTATRTAIGCY